MAMRSSEEQIDVCARIASSRSRSMTVYARLRFEQPGKVLVKAPSA